MTPNFPRQNQAVVLRNTDPIPLGLRLRGCHPLRRGFPTHFGFPEKGAVGSITPHPCRLFAYRFGLGSPPFGRPYSGDPILVSSPPPTKMFPFGGFPLGTHPSIARAFPSVTGYSPVTGSPIRRSPVRRLHASTRGISPLAASFLGARAEPSTRRLTCVRSSWRGIRGRILCMAHIFRIRALHPRGYLPGCIT